MHFRGFLFLAVGFAAAAPPPPAAAAATAPWPQTMEHIPLFVVSLARSPWRWADFVASGDALRDFPTLQRVDAVDGRGVDTRNDSRLSLSARVTIMRGSRRDHTDINTLGMVGCYLSHLALWQRIAAEGGEPSPNSPEQFAKFIAAEVVKWGALVRASGAQVD